MPIRNFLHAMQQRILVIWTLHFASVGLKLLALFNGLINCHRPHNRQFFRQSFLKLLGVTNVLHWFFRDLYWTKLSLLCSTVVDANGHWPIVFEISSGYHLSLELGRKVKANLFFSLCKILNQYLLVLIIACKSKLVGFEIHWSSLKLRIENLSIHLKSFWKRF